MTPEEASAFFAQMVGHGIRPQDVREIAERIFRRSITALTELTRAELNVLRTNCIDIQKREKNGGKPPRRGLDAPIHEDEGATFEDLAPY